ncbi:PREDICTED: nucleolin [Prunus mume]|uniref:Nucleolin n=1 Tax=Prunus mume TaxID=102107 RepID=A0ABM0N8J5_PRUMU|nr:PREDICTED: nucleolin [Prunus mume]
MIRIGERKEKREREMKRNTKKETERDEVEELLQAAQDDMLLKLSLNSHLSRGVSLDDADIGRRFEALKMKTVITGAAPGPGPGPAAAASSVSKSNSNSIQVDEELKEVLGDDLSTRFAALKASIPMPSSDAAVRSSASSYNDIVNDNDDEDEVEKLIRWAKDAARLDPSPPSDDDDDQDKSESDDDDHHHHEPKGNVPDRK